MYTQTATHATLLARLSNGSDDAAWAEFHQRYGELIRRFARGRYLQPSDCDDVLQDVLLSLSKAMLREDGGGFRYDPAKGKFRAYLKTMVIHAVAKKSRQKAPAQSLGEVEEATRAMGNDPSVEEDWESQWRQHHVRNAMVVVEAEFKDSDLEAFRRYALLEQEAAGVAESLGMSVESVYQAKSRIMKRLAHAIESQVADEG